MSQTLAVIKDRYSCKSFSPRTVPAETLRAIAEAGCQAPSAMNRQPWRFVVVSDPALVAELDAVGLGALQQQDQAAYQRTMARGGRLFYGAPHLLLICTQALDGIVSVDLDAGIAAATIVLAAASLGLDTCMCGMARWVFAGADADQWRQRIRIPDGFQFGVGILIGYAADTGRAPHEPDYSKIVLVD